MPSDPLQVPFSSAVALQSSSSKRLPTTFRARGQPLQNTKDNIEEFLSCELRTTRLDEVHQHLWLAGLPRPAHPLHRQVSFGRRILISEDPDEHLTWHHSYNNTFVFIKPLPEFLLDYEFWKDELCKNLALHKSACGLLLSYAWLIGHRSDLKIAHKESLVPESITWEAWLKFMEAFMSYIGDPDLQTHVDRRYAYGDLRISRLNSLYRFGYAGWSLHKLVHGFMSGSTRYTAFFESNFGWMLAVFVYLSVVLSAMQVALATDRLGKDDSFQGFSYGFSLLSISIVLGAIFLIFLVWVSLFWFHLLSTKQYCKGVAARREKKELEKA
ncbi:unnamed protein product [Clonostachys rosea]|uniref:Subtilisin-like serine protease n=1 Tax=Bionectria ochroleuca TaxID=29856 RepID=A0ABY6TRH3_BIOOC|nr:unnamed protein product [Clonostachys rosea]